MKFWSLLCQYYDLWSLGSNSSFPFKCALLATPSPSTPGESYLFHNWFVKQLKRLTSKGILVSFVSGIRCFNAAPPPQCLHNTGSVQGCERDEGRPTINFTQCTLHCHHTSVLHVDLQSKLLFMWMLRWKVESDVVDPDRWSCRLVGRCPQTGSRSQRCRYSGHVTSKTSHTQHLGLYVFPHKITKLQEFWVFRKENILI